MELKDALLGRKSTRGFKDTPVPKDVLEDVLKMGTRAVSALNAQPWEFVVLSGELKDKIAARNVERFMSGDHEDILDPPMVGKYRDRMVGVAKQLFGAMEIAREDKERRLWWTTRGYRFFDAPAVIMVCINKDCDEAYHRIDLGAVCQNIALAAMVHGLGTCVELQAVSYQAGVTEFLPEHADKKFVIGIAIGYPDEDFPANSVVSTREDVNDITSWYGFED